MAVTRKGGAGISVVPRVLGREGFKLLLACSKAPTASELVDSKKSCLIFSRVCGTANKIIIIIIIIIIITTGTIHATLLLLLPPPLLKPLLEEGVFGAGPELGVEGFEVGGIEDVGGREQGKIVADRYRVPPDVVVLVEVRL